MKLRVKYITKEKFILSLLQSEPTFSDLKESIVKYVSDNFGENNAKFEISLNGIDPIITENEKDLLSNLGIVNNDLLIIIHNTTNTSTSATTSCQPNRHTKNRNKNSASNKMEDVTEQSSSFSEQMARTQKISEVTSLLEARDTEPPPIVVDIFEKYAPSSADQAINLLVHITMLECGFFVQDGEYSLITTLPVSWKDNVSTIKYHHPRFNQFTCTIVIVTMGNIKQILASFVGQESEISVRLKTSDYLQTNQILPHRLTKLSQFARTLRNKLLYPLQVAAHETLGLPAPWHLAALPQEILILMMSFLDLKSILNLTMTCKGLNVSGQDNKLWFILFKRDFKSHSHVSDKIGGADWKAKYQTIYKRVKIEKEKSRQENINQRPNVNPTPNFGEPFNPYMPNQPFNPYMPDPYYPMMPDPPMNPFRDPDSPYFGGEIPHPYAPFPHQPNPLGPFGGGRPGPRQPQNPFQPSFMPPRRGNPSFEPRFL